MLRARLATVLVPLCCALGCGAHSATPLRASSPSGARELLAPERVVALSLSALSALSPLSCGVRVTLRIAPGYHIMSNRPSQPVFIATQVTLRSDALRLEPPTYPEATPYALADQTIATFRGDTEILVPCAAGSGAMPASARVDVTLRYQACTETSCLFPITRQFSESLIFPTKTANLPAP